MLASPGAHGSVIASFSEAMVNPSARTDAAACMSDVVRSAVNPSNTAADGTLLRMAEPRTVHIAYSIAQDEDGVWCARAQLHPGVVAYGDGDTEQAAIDDLREGVLGLIEEFGVPRELKLTIPDAA